MTVETYSNESEGIKCVYNNGNWLVSIKNWKPDNDIEGVSHLEIHHKSDEQFILVQGKALLITAERSDNKFQDIKLTPMRVGEVLNVSKEQWFYSITQKDTKIVYVQAADTSLDNSDFADLTDEQVAEIQQKATTLLEEL
ncbi:hypothetical protein ACFQ41_06590 [Lacticaseibacillus suilingensis]|uniref:Cupin n=1 Tax=Lacticaseibacillus suilingensis TaxID=2799577 RepID=A0ABW4BEQ1_9LACO|nr:hypothetical protein [Lacticaseibacillus suilingensis]